MNSSILFDKSLQFNKINELIINTLYKCKVWLRI